MTEGPGEPDLRGGWGMCGAWVVVQEKHEQTQKLQLLCRDRFQGPGIGVKLK